SHILFVGGVSDTLMHKLLALRNKQVKIPGGLPDKSSEDSIQIINNQIISCLKNPYDINNNVLFYHTITNTIVKRGGVNFPVPLSTNVIKAQGRIFIPGWDYHPGEVMTRIVVGKFLLRKTGIGLWNIVIMSLYFGLLAWMGWFFSKRQKNTNDYFRGGGKMSWWIVALSIYGTSLSSITYMAIPAKAYATDWSYMVYNFGVITAIPVIVLLFIPFYRKLNITTAYEYLEMRFNVTVRVLASVAFMIFQIGRMAIVLFLPSIAINIITGFDIFLCIALMGVISLIYTAMGGIEAVIWTDAIQIFILFGGAIITLMFISTGLDDGFIGIISTASENGKFHMAETSIDFRKPTLITALVATFFASLTTYGTDQTMVQRYMTTPTQKMAVKSLWAKVLIAIPGGLLFFFIGSALYVFYKTEPSNLSFTITDGDAIFPWFIFTQMPAVLSGLLLSGILAAAMSTVSASMNSVATAYSVDIHFRFGWMKKVNQLKVARVASVFFGLTGILLALMMATWEIVSLWDQFIKILGLIMGSFGGLFLLGILTKRASGTGAVIGIIASVLVQIWIDQNHIVHGLLYVATGSFTCFIIGYIASLFFPESKKEITNLTV
ncbi:MAG TPA: sodium:solute symporter, partial [Bacteroidales bacterium]|nr:sodium:solute symporter [Bacteroidales bacterium]